MKLTVTGTVTKGALDTKAAQAFWRSLNDFNGLVLITLETYKSKRSQRQNSLMWAAHLDAIVKIFEQSGNEMTRKDIHEWCKERFLPDEGRKAIIVNGEIVGERRSTTWLSTEGMNTYLTRLEVFIAENGGTIERVKH